MSNAGARGFLPLALLLALPLAGCGGSDEEDGGGATGFVKPGETLTVEPGEPTICSRGTPFRFFVAGGEAKKIIVDFRGGGACWNKATCAIKDGIFSAEAPTEEQAKKAFLETPRGIYKRDRDGNAVKDWTLIHIPYCTGDVHWGDAVVDYDAATGLTIHHKGYVNAMATLDWIKEHYQPEEILVTGCSAGAYGAIGHAPHIQDAFPKAKVTVIADSGCGVVTDDFFKYSFPNWNAQIPRQVPALADVDILTLTIVDLYTAVGQHYTDMRIAQQTTAFDKDQTFYYTAMGGAEADWSPKMMESMTKISANTPNFAYYMSPGPLHCLHPYDSFYERKSENVAYTEWFEQMVNGDTAPASVTCTAATCKSDPVCAACADGTSSAPECSWCEGWTGN